MLSNINSETQIIDFIKRLPTINAAQSDWKNCSFAQKKTIFKNILSSYEKYSEEILQSESLDQNLTKEFIEKASYKVGYENLKNIFKDFENSENLEIEKKYFPVGIVTVILSWNLFNRLFIESVIAAVFSGNAVIVKASSQTIRSLNIWKKILNEVGLPDDLIVFVITRDKNFKSLLVSHPSVKSVKFYGHLEHGLEVLKNSQINIKNNFKKISMNLGSKNAALYFSDFNESTASEVLNSFYIGQGQIAWNSAKLYISEKQEKIWQEFIKDSEPQFFKDDQSNEINSLVASDQGQFFVEDLWVKNLSRCSTLQHDELNKPVFILETVKYPFDVPKRLNAGYYGFTCSIWGESDRLSKIAKDIDVGLVSFNEWSVYKNTSFSGVKQSSYGIRDCRIFGELYCDVRKMT